jgi:hypothetical protein
MLAILTELKYSLFQEKGYSWKDVNLSNLLIL